MKKYKNIILITAMKFELEIFCKNLLKYNFIKINIDFLSHDLKRSLYIFKNDKKFIQIIMIFSGVSEHFLNLKTIFNFLENNLNDNEATFDINFGYLVGLSGACNENYKVGTVLEVGKVKFGKDVFVLDKNKKITLLTSDKIMKFDDKKKISNLVDIVDMETFFWIKELQDFINLKNIKVFRSISDDLSFKFPETLNDLEISKKIFSIIRGNLGIFKKEF